jgi:hypothetical protein
MATLSDEHLRALRFLAHYTRGCTEATLLEEGFTTGRVKITAAGRKAIAE